PARSAARVGLAGDLDRAALEAAQAGEGVDQLGLAVAVDARDPDDLPRPHVERDAPHLLQAAVVENVQVLDCEQRLPGCRGWLLDAEQDLAADHHAGEALLGRTLLRDGR